MSRPKVHKARLLKLMTLLRDVVSVIVEHKLIKYPYTSLNEVELNIHDLTKEIERVELAK